MLVGSKFVLGIGIVGGISIDLSYSFKCMVGYFKFSFDIWIWNGSRVRMSLCYRDLILVLKSLI